MERLNRRQFVAGLSIVTLTTVSGCSGEDSSGGGGSGPDEDSGGGGGSGSDEDSGGGGGSGSDENSGGGDPAENPFSEPGSDGDGADSGSDDDDSDGGGSGPDDDDSGGGGSDPDEDSRGGESDTEADNEESGSAQFETTIEHADTMFVGHRETVTVSVENVGERAGKSDILFKLHTVEDAKEISLPSGHATELTFDFEVPDNPGDYNLRVANEAAQEVVRNSVSIIQPADVFELTEVIKGEWECFEVSQFKDLESVDWQFEITNEAGVQLDSEEILLEIRAYDGAKRTVGTFNARGIAPSPGSPSVFRTNKEDMPEESCDYVTTIVEGTGEDGGGLSITGVQW